MERTGKSIDLLEEVYAEFDLINDPERINKKDKTGMPLDPPPPKIIALKGLIKRKCTPSVWDKSLKFT